MDLATDTTTDPTPAASAAVPTTLRRVAEARGDFGPLATTYLEAMWRGDPLADAYVADFARIGHGRGMRMLRRACRDGIESLPEAPDTLRALFAQLDDVPDWVDLAGIDRDSRDVGRYSRQSGIALGAASLVSGYANSAASRPLELTGRFVENAGARTIEVSSWLDGVGAPGGLDRHGEGFELTVRVRLIHALVRAALREDPRWEREAWGEPICQAYLAYTLVEFALIPLRGTRTIGARWTAREEAAAYARWRYIGHLLGIDADLLPADAADQERLEAIYLMTRPPVDTYCRDLVASIGRDFLVPEVEQLLPRRLHGHAPQLVHALERVFLGDELSDELDIGRTRLVHVVRGLGRVFGVVNAGLDRVPAVRATRARTGDRYRISQEDRLRAAYGVEHDLVDTSPEDRAHPARTPAED